MRLIIAAALLGLTLSGCVTPDVELPDNDSSGADAMRQSPCVCLELRDYDGRGFEWRS